MSAGAVRRLALLALLASAVPGIARACGTSCADPCPLAAPRQAWQTISGVTTQASPSFFYSVHLGRGRLLEAQTCFPGSAPYDSRIRLRAQGCGVLADNDDFCGLQSRVLLPSAPDTGTYVVEVTGFTTFSTGPYTLAYRGDGESPDVECGNRLDDDGDGLTDCSDPDCTDAPNCVETCDDGDDDDADGLVDCDDPECGDSPSCPETCDNGVDDDANGRVDCADIDCFGAPPCLEAGRCSNGRDDDVDGRTDCWDEDCIGADGCERAMRPEEAALLHAHREGADVVVTWDSARRDMAGLTDRAVGWSLHRGTAGDFVPGRAGAEVAAIGSGGATARDSGAVGDSINRYYLVTERGLSGRSSNARAAGIEAPVDLTADLDADGNVVLSWTASGPASRLAGYTLYRGTEPSRYVERIDAGTELTVRLTTLAPEWSRFVVTATDVDGNETFPSNEVVAAPRNTAVTRVIDHAEISLLGPSPGWGWEPRGVVEVPDRAWTSATAILTLDSGLADGCACTGTDACGGDQHAVPVDAFLVLDPGCLSGEDSCLSWDVPQLELLRAVTPMGTDSRTGPRVLVQDVTPFASLLRGRIALGLSLPTMSFAGWHASLDLRLSADPAQAAPRPPAAGVAPVFLREFVSADNQQDAAPELVTIPPQATRVVARIWVSGHGSVDPGGRPECTGAADEFCRKLHHLVVDGSDAWSGEVWHDCAPGCDAWNACSLASCSASRAGGCPGELACHSPSCDPDVDVTPFFAPGDHVVGWRIDDPTPGGDWGYSVALYWY